jgi:hypothetical protein
LLFHLVLPSWPEYFLLDLGIADAHSLAPTLAGLQNKNTRFRARITLTRGLPSPGSCRAGSHLWTIVKRQTVSVRSWVTLPKNHWPDIR